MTAAGAPGSSWLRHDGAPTAVRLVCLAHAGAGAASFNRWSGLLGPHVGVVRIQLPGREDLAAEPPLRRVADVVAALAPGVARLAAAGPVALYGHSMGALLAFELTRTLRAARLPPAHLFVSGRRAPHLPASRQPIHTLPDEEFLAALSAMGGTGAGGSPALRRYALRVTRADLALTEEYVSRTERRLGCPVTAFHGLDDPIVDVAEAAAWETETDGPFELRTFPGHHFFNQLHREAVAAHIARALGAGPAHPDEPGRDEVAAQNIAS